LQIACAWSGWRGCLPWCGQIGVRVDGDLSRALQVAK
jgi:hypothetical protein